MTCPIPSLPRLRSSMTRSPDPVDFSIKPPKVNWTRVVVIVGIASWIMAIAFLGVHGAAVSASLKAELVQAQVEDAIIGLQFARAERRMAALIADIRRLSRGLINAGQAREIVRILDGQCDADFTRPRIMMMIRNESRWDPRAVGAKGEIGLMQLMPASVQVPKEELFDPAKNVFYGIGYLKDLRAYYGDPGLAIAHFAEGFTAGKKYARRIIDARDVLGE